MRTTGMGRSFATLLALMAACGCTVQAGDGDGKQRGPVRIELPSKSPSATGNSPDSPDADSAGPSDSPGPPGSSDSSDSSDSSTDDKPSSAPVLWSKGDTGGDVRELQARLRQVAWLYDGPTGSYDGLTEQAVKGFQGKRGLPRTGKTDTVTWQRLLRMTHEPGKWDLYLMGGQPADPPDARCMTGRVLCISKTSRTLRWMIDGRTVTTVPVRFGSQGTPTREGVFSVYWKSRHHVSTLYDSPMPYAMFFSGGQAVHYSSDFAAQGYAGASHGCVNVRDEAAIADLFTQVRDGDKVVVHW